MGEGKSRRTGTCLISPLIRQTSVASITKSSASTSQSGKGGVAYLTESGSASCCRRTCSEFGPIANDEVDKLGREVSGGTEGYVLAREYIERDFSRGSSKGSRPKPQRRREVQRRSCCAMANRLNWLVRAAAHSAALVHAFHHCWCRALKSRTTAKARVERGVKGPAPSPAIQIKTRRRQGAALGRGVDTNIELASVRAVLSALNRRVELMRPFSSHNLPAFCWELSYVGRSRCRFYAEVATNLPGVMAITGMPAPPNARGAPPAHA